MTILTNEDISNAINESAYESSTRIFNLQGLGQSCERDTSIGVVGQFARDCSISRSDIDQVRGCHLTYTGDKASVSKKMADSKQSAQQNLAVNFVTAAKKNKCSPGSSFGSKVCRLAKEMKIVPGSHNIQNLAQTTELLTSMIQDTMANTCSSSTGGINAFLCTDSKLDKLYVQQGEEVDTIASCVSRNIDKDSIKQRASVSIEQTADVATGNNFQHFITIGVISLGIGVSYLVVKWGSGKPLDKHPAKGVDDSDIPKTSIFVHFKLKLLALVFIWIVVAVGIFYIKEKNIGSRHMINADLMTPSMCQDCTKYNNKDDCNGLGLCTWVPKPVSAPNICPPDPAASPMSCLSPTALEQKINLLQGTEGTCTCEPIFNKNTGEMMGDCTNQCPNFRNKTDCLEALCGWAETNPVLVEAPGTCIAVRPGTQWSHLCPLHYHDEYQCNQSNSPATAPDERCKWFHPKRVQSQGGGYCTGDSTHCHPGQKINRSTNLENALAIF